MSSVAGGIDGLEAVFDDASLVGDAGLLLAGTVMGRLGLVALIDETVRPAGSAGSGSGRKVLTLVASMLVGGRCIDDAQRLRSVWVPIMRSWALTRGFALHPGTRNRYQESVHDAVHEDSASARIAAGQRPRPSFRHPQGSA